MKKIVFVVTLLSIVFIGSAQQLDDVLYPGQSCTSIMVGKKASKDGSVVTSHTCDGRYRTWVSIEPAKDWEEGSVQKIYKGTMHTISKNDKNGVKEVGEIPQVAHTFAYLNTAYPCLNEKQLAIGESTFSGPDTLVNPNNMFMIEELERVALMRCSTARDAIKLMGELINKYGYADGGECLTIADTKEVWQMEICGAGKDQPGGVWVAQRVPDDEVAVSCNIPRIGKIDRSNKNYFMVSDNVEEVAKKYGLWDGQGDFVFWKAYFATYANGKNFREREFFIFNTLAPSLHLNMEMAEIPFSIKPDEKVDIQKVMELFRSTFAGTDLDMTQNLKITVNKKDKDGKAYTDTVISPVANPWMTNTTLNTFNALKPGTVTFRRTVAVAWCSYSHIIQLRDWLPDEIGGVCWFSVDNPAESPRIPIFCGTTKLPAAFSRCGQRGYDEQALVWKYRKANKLATVAWGRTKNSIEDNVRYYEEKVLNDLPVLEKQVKQFKKNNATDDIRKLLNGYTADITGSTINKWGELEQSYWNAFGLGF